MGRLALQHGHREAAQERLTAALTLQQQRGDVAGLARSTALAELCMTAGHLGDAVALLADSITLNFAKGSPIGLAFNRQTLGALTKAATQAHGPDAEQLRGRCSGRREPLGPPAVLGRVGNWRVRPVVQWEWLSRAIMARNAGLTDSKRGVLWSRQVLLPTVLPLRREAQAGIAGVALARALWTKLRPIVLLLGRAVVGAVYGLLKEIETP